MTIAEFFATYPVYLVLFATVIGLIVGSFLNVVIYRYPIMMEREWQSECRLLLELADEPPAGEDQTPEHFNLAKPDSHCPKCKTPISALENIPVVSWLLQQGKCKHCQNPISARYPIIETITARSS